MLLIKRSTVIRPAAPLVYFRVKPVISTASIIFLSNVWVRCRWRTVTSNLGLETLRMRCGTVSLGLAQRFRRTPCHLKDSGSSTALLHQTIYNWT
ncbi:hypothetical protein Y032_0095g2856 [Ancylostoma ceylanicum]|uniref:Uncharacterized protein n=1 Tax=Ancylostoma ceylanicum TaxID=53326 RepID=A0A016TKQ1_9BILA|nr:hypothetical protein Y032_0095g2856 [Ancylostoma ceylanicum]